MRESLRIGHGYIRDLSLRAQARGDLITWTIYDHPTDFPTVFVARPFSSKDGKALTVHFSHESLDAVRGALENQGLTKIARHDDDDPCIVESWI